MTDQQHPITPPPELVQQWLGEYFGCTVNGELSESEKHLATQAANWGYKQGANAELEACIEWLGDAPVVYNDNGDLHPGSYLRDARRPKPPSLKEQALAALAAADGADHPVVATVITADQHALIRAALESLPS